MTTDVEALAKRIQAVEWDEDERRAKSHVLLAREFLRRSALWAQALDRVQEWPFFDIAEIVDPEVRADPAVIRDLVWFLQDRGVSWWAEHISLWALHFAALPQKRQDLPDPYEPLLVMFERGGTFNTETSFMNIDYVVGLPFGRWQDHLSTKPLTTLSPAELDARDNL